MRSSVLAVLGIDPEALLRSFGTLGLFAIIFAESGLFFGFFLPGDSLLFIAGFLSWRGDLWPIWAISLGCFVAAVAGDQVGYAFGHKAGPRLFNRPSSRLFKHEHLMRAEDFFERHGPRTIFIARFVPVVRTFAPIVAGASKMHYRTFVTYNIVGGFVWAVGFTQLGYWVGQAFPGIGDRIEYFVVLVVAVSLLPIAIEFLRHRKDRRPAEAGVALTDDASDER